MNVFPFFKLKNLKIGDGLFWWVECARSQFGGLS